MNEWTPLINDEWESLLNDVEDGGVFILRGDETVAVMLDIGSYDAMVNDLERLSRKCGEVAGDE